VFHQVSRLHGDVEISKVWRSTVNSLRRTIWAVLAIGHGLAVPALVLALASGDVGSNLARLFGLSAAVWFCFLKALDVRWLRIRPGWRATVGSFIVAALLHANVLIRQAGAESDTTPAPLAAALLATLLVEPDAFRQAVRELRARAGLPGSFVVGGRIIRAFLAWAAIDWHWLRSPVCGLVCQGPRPPPAR
jgi:hypothetical protein